jgi:hypothetical protein
MGQNGEMPCNPRIADSVIIAGSRLPQATCKFAVEPEPLNGGGANMPGDPAHMNQLWYFAAIERRDALQNDASRPDIAAVFACPMMKIR